MAASALLLLALLPAASAQLPTEAEPFAASTLHIVVQCDGTLLEPQYAREDEVHCTLQDLSRDSVFLPGQNSGTSPNQHQVFLTAVPREASANATGWQVLVSRPIISLAGGDVVDFTVNIKATPLIDSQDYHFDLVAQYHGPGGYNSTHVVPFTAEVERYDFALLSWAGLQSQRAGQDQIVTYSILIENSGVYPESFRIATTSSKDILVTAPPSVYIPAGESRVVNVSVLTPHGKIYEPGRSELIAIKVSSASGTGTYTTTGILQLRGPYLPLYWIPLFLVGAVSAGVLARGTKESRELHRLERGRPRPVGLTPRQEALLAEMRRTNPEAYKEKRRSLALVYQERVADYRAHRKERMAADREEAKQAKLEYVAQRAAKKAQRKEEALAKKAAHREAKAQAKIDRKEAKLLAKKEQVLAKKRKALEKAKAKADAKQAKLDAKAAKAAEKDAKKAAREQKKAEKAAKKGAK